MEPNGIALVLGVAVLALAVLVFGPGLVLKVQTRRRGHDEPPTFLGPLFWAEWQRLNRRGSQVWLRIGYVLLLLFGLFALYLDEFAGSPPLAIFAGGSLPLDRVARLAESYFSLHLWLQFLALTVVTPIFVGASIFEEQEHRTLDLLLSSMLTRREIVMGKLAARVAFVLSLAATGLPVLALAMHFGGVDGTWLVCAVVVTVFYTIGLATFIFWFATRVKFSQSIPAVLAVTFGLSFHLPYFTLFLALLSPDFAGLSPFHWLISCVLRSEPPIRATLVSVFFNSVVALVCGYFANPRSREVRSPRRARKRPRRLRRFPRIDAAAPLLWKEKYFTIRTYWERQPSERRLVKVATIVGAVFLAASLLFFVLDLPLVRVFTAIFGGATAIVVVDIPPMAGLLLTSSVTRERQKLTLESLLSLPYGWDELLAAKWEVMDLFYRPYQILYAIAAATMVLCLAVHPVAAVVVVAVLFAELRFFLALGLWLSVRCRSTVRAILWCLTAAFAVFLLPVLLSSPVARLTTLLGWPAGVVEDVVSSLSPVVAVKLCFATWSKTATFESWFVEAGTGAVTALLYLAASVWLWRNACRTFGRDEWS
ncbi:ABC transporter permease subunit [Limnoglobus roseus]|uniref:ABC transporter permease n=1 Tax=Limnoglobus roseus TaxID=2598579 RepID=A0A5C1AAI1_9BACT|nr:ABC transporter permease subunit [Limnoglobus roseus]QEL15227.1 ABC transporter permease [Limnoglobus roseus]